MRERERVLGCKVDTPVHGCVVVYGCVGGCVGVPVGWYNGVCGCVGGYGNVCGCVGGAVCGYGGVCHTLALSGGTGSMKGQ